MPVLTAYIVDDDPRAVKRARKLVEGRGDLILVGTATDPRKALADIAKYRPDLVLLDLEMEPMDGWQVMEQLDPAIRVIICTVETEVGPKTYQFRAAYYLTKPYRKSDFDHAIDRIWEGVDNNDIRLLPTQPNYVWFTAGGKRHKVRLSLDDIEAVEADGNYSKVYYTHGTMMIDQSLKEVERLLPAGQFMRIHRCSIMALNRYLVINGDTIQLQHVVNTEIARLKLGEHYAQRFYNYLDEQ